MALRAGQGEVRVHAAARVHPRQLQLHDGALIRSPLGWLLVGAASVVVSYASAFLPAGAPAFAPWLLAFGTVALLIGLLAAGAVKEERSGPATWVFLGTGAWLMLGFGIVLSLPVEDPEAPRLLLGLPLRTAVLFYGVGLAPAFVVPWLYARLFDAHTLGDDDLRRLHEASARVKAGTSGTGAPADGTGPAAVDPETGGPS